MKKFKKKKQLIVVASIFGFISLLFFFPFLFKQMDHKTEATSEKEEGESFANACELTIQVSGSDEPIDLEEYVIGVVSAEMPANFHPEALKAQAIAARTYVLKNTEYGKKAIEPTVAKQVFYDSNTRKEVWAESFDDYEKKVRQAVESTKGEVINYNGELITAMFHSMSNGMTESSKNYSGTDLPYLQSVASTDFQYADNYEVEKSFTINEWNQLLNTNLTLNQLKNVRIKRNNTGRVETVIVGKNEWSGRDMRTLLDLRSTDFRIEVKGEKIVVTTEGYGHGVGMSQYGADAMAENGATAHEIIQHYYKNTNIEKISCK
ncbi:stage II sporulation protein D [Lysinibacillus endophyticus]|uniref:stage II sporulation protein D n=1 Tax=Ureibacillus endophyticus TaxID=1978490 RepID=UPI0020A18808|nr:stage II sporulation protein D [Lysinibacillus endophyticus]MCP1143629.1 stage II sporulation protein D [Lysinibacillus endophyticus]